MQQVDSSENLNVKKRVKCEVYSRVVGYMRPVSHWNDAKQEEYKDRKTYDIKKTR